MNEFILAEMITQKLKGEIGIVEKPLPKEIRALDGELSPSRKIHFEASLYQAEKLKKISILRNQLGDNQAGSVIMVIPADEYDLPFVVVDISFLSGQERKVFAEFDPKLLLRDKESSVSYIEPFTKWREELGRLPSEPRSDLPEVGEFIKAAQSQLFYQRYVPHTYAAEVLGLADRFFDIYSGIYRSAKPVKDPERRGQMDAFRAQYNKYLLEQEPAARGLVRAFGQERAQLYLEYLVKL